MSRVGKYPVPVPAGVQVALQGRTVVATGKNGELKLALTDEVDITIESGSVAVAPSTSDAVVVGAGTGAPVKAIRVTPVGFTAATYPAASGSVTSLASPPVMRSFFTPSATAARATVAISSKDSRSLRWRNSYFSPKCSSGMQ